MVLFRGLSPPPFGVATGYVVFNSASRRFILFLYILCAYVVNPIATSNNDNPNKSFFIRQICVISVPTGARSYSCRLLCGVPPLNDTFSTNILKAIIFKISCAEMCGSFFCYWMGHWGQVGRMFLPHPLPPLLKSERGCN